MSLGLSPSLDNLKAGELEAARTAFIALVNYDPSVSSDPNLVKIGAAQHFASRLQGRGVQLQTNPSA